MDVGDTVGITRVTVTSEIGVTTNVVGIAGIIDDDTITVPFHTVAIFILTARHSIAWGGDQIVVRRLPQRVQDR